MLRAAQIHRGDDQAPHQLLRRVERAQLRARGLLAQRAEVDPQLVRRLPRPLVGLGAQDPAHPQVQRLERLDRIHAITASASISISISGEMSRRTSTMLVAGRMVAEHLAVRPGELLPAADVGHVHPGAHDVVQRRAGPPERRLDVLERLRRLGVGIPHADDRAVGSGRRRAGDVHGVADPHRARVADDRLPGRATGDELSFHAGLADEGPWGQENSGDDGGKPKRCHRLEDRSAASLPGSPGWQPGGTRGNEAREEDGIMSVHACLRSFLLSMSRRGCRDGIHSLHRRRAGRRRHPGAHAHSRRPPRRPRLERRGGHAGGRAQRPVDLIIADYRMPGLTGLDLGRPAREGEATRSRSSS